MREASRREFLGMFTLPIGVEAEIDATKAPSVCWNRLSLAERRRGVLAAVESSPPVFSGGAVRGPPPLADPPLENDDDARLLEKLFQSG